MLRIPDEIMDLYRQDGIKKYIRITFPNSESIYPSETLYPSENLYPQDSERSDLTNDDLSAESLSFREGLPNDSDFCLGLCDASTLEFECNAEVGNIKGMTIHCCIEIDTSSLEGYTNPYSISLGYFVVDSCKKNSSGITRRVTAYGYNIDDSAKVVFSNLEQAKRLYALENGLDYKINFAFLLTNNLSPVWNTDIGHTLTSLVEETWSHGGAFSNWDGGTCTNNSKDIGFGVSQIRYHLATEEDFKKLYYINNTINVDRATETLFRLFRNELAKRGDDFKDEKTSKYVRDSIIGWAVKQAGSVQIEYRRWKSKTEYERLPMPYDNSGGRRNAVYIWDQTKFFYPYISGLTYGTGAKGLVDAYLYIPVSIDLYICDYYTHGNKEYLIQENKGALWGDNSLTFEEHKLYEVTDTELLLMSDIQVVNTSGLKINDIIDGLLELDGCWGRFGREGYFETFRPNKVFGLYPSETLYPSESLYPQDPSGGVVFKSSYISCSRDDEPFKPYDRVSVTYENISGTTVQTSKQFVKDILDLDVLNDSSGNAVLDSDGDHIRVKNPLIVYVDGYNPDDYRTYSLGYNYLIQNARFTAEQIDAILTKVAEAVKNIRYVPSEIILIGCPWLEAGDVVNVVTRDGNFSTLITSRSMKGIYFLEDNFEGRG